MKIILLTILLCFTLQIDAQSRKWCFYPSIGVDMGGAIPFPFSDIPKGSQGTPKISPSVGLAYEYSLTEKWGLGCEVSYHVLAFSANADVRSQPFYFDNHQSILYFSGKTDTDVELRFLQIPVVVTYSLNPNWTILAGAYYSRIFEGSFITRGSEGVISDDKILTDTVSLPGVADITYNFNDYIDNWDAGILFGFRYSISQKLFFWSNFNVGFKSIFKPDFDYIDYDMYQLRLNIGISIAFPNKSLKRNLE